LNIARLFCITTSVSAKREHLIEIFVQAYC
jgi:hypothetical protein